MRIIYCLMMALILSSCAGSKLSKTLEQGETQQKVFKTTIPFEYRYGLIVLKVEIQNNTYDFLLDTGASNVLSQELADKLNYKVLGSEEIFDIHTDSQNLKYTKIDKVNVGGIDFVGTIAAITDFNKTPELACLGVDGFIGANLMRRAVWDFDFDNQLITITDDENKLNIPQDYSESKLFIGHAGLASIITEVNGQRALNNVIDFGNNGYTRLPALTFVKQRKKKIITNYIKADGYNGVGVYGKGKKRTFFNAKIDEIKIGNQLIKDEIVFVDGTVSGNLGINFFKNYRVILNWSSRRIKLIEKESRKTKRIENYGFRTIFSDNKLYVGTIFEKTNAVKLLKLGDQILFINDKNYSHITNEKLCVSGSEGYMDDSLKTISIVVLRDNKELVFQLDKETLL